MRYVLTVNAGSSSLKAAVFELHPLREVCSATIENIGQPGTTLRATNPGGSAAEPLAIDAPTHPATTRHMVDWLEQAVGVANVVAVGHRVVHGGDLYDTPHLLDDRAMDNLRTLENLDPEHLPAALESISELRRHFPHSRHVACFDTAFYRTLPRTAQLLPLPRRLEKFGLRRYGFHGLSYAYLLDSFARHEGSTAAHGRIIMAHLGSGASLAALKDARPIDTTMGFTPASGIPMSTRSGDIDPGIVWYLHRISDQGSQQFNHMVNKESGLLGVSETTADMHTLLQLQHTDQRAAEAVELFCYHIRKQIGALTAVLGGVDSLIFSGGVGERSAEIRRRVCEPLAYLGIELDPQRNRRSQRLISRQGAPAGVHVIPTDEAVVIAKQTIATIQQIKEY